MNDEAILSSSTMAGTWSWVGDDVSNILQSCLASARANRYELDWYMNESVKKKKTCRKAERQRRGERG